LLRGLSAKLPFFFFAFSRQGIGETAAQGRGGVGDLKA
jgi:hypothetical protein